MKQRKEAKLEVRPRRFVSSQRRISRTRRTRNRNTASKTIPKKRYGACSSTGT